MPQPAAIDPVTLSGWLPPAFVLLTVVTLLAWIRLTGRRLPWLAAGIAWAAFTGWLAYRGFFLTVDTFPPRLALVMVPALVVGLILGFSRWGAAVRSASSLEGLHYLHAVRVLVETVFLHGLYTGGYVARELTYHGLNFDLYTGLLLPLTGWLVFRLRVLSRKWSVAVNLLGVAVLVWTVAVAVLSAPTSYQVFGRDQPTVAIFLLPFVWLPTLIVPLMFWAHFIVIGRLLGTYLVRVKPPPPCAT